jgi:hypothetical protein
VLAAPRRYLIGVPRPLPAAPLVVHRRALFIYRGDKAVPRNGARCVSQVLDRGAWAGVLGAARCFSHVLDRGAPLPRHRGAFAAGEEQLCCSAVVQRKIVNFTRVKRRVIRVRVIMTAVNCSPAVASRRAKYVDEFRVSTLLGAQPLDALFLGWLFQIRLSCSRGEARSQSGTRSQ